MHQKNHLNYVRKVVSLIRCSRSIKNQIREDLLATLAVEVEKNSDIEPAAILGPPEQVAAEFKENLGLPASFGFEYRSNLEFCGLPLIHVNTLGQGYAQGIIAIGRVAVGFVSVGAVALGVISFGAFSLGLAAAIGAVTFSGLTSVGATAFSGFLSIGAVATAYNFSASAWAN